jgi:hypothetical protein
MPGTAGQARGVVLAGDAKGSEGGAMIHVQCQACGRKLYFDPKPGKKYCCSCGKVVHHEPRAVAEEKKTGLSAGVWALIIVVLLIHIVSFWLPTLDKGNMNVVFYKRVLCGWEVFCFVILTLPFSFIYLPAWIANWELWFGLFTLVKKGWRRARMWAWLCVPLALSSLPVAHDNLGRRNPLLIGYYVWLLSMLAFLIGVESLRLSARKKARIAKVFMAWKG